MTNPDTLEAGVKMEALCLEIAEAVMGNPTVEALFAPDERDQFKSDIQIEAARVLGSSLAALPAAGAVKGLSDGCQPLMLSVLIGLPPRALEHLKLVGFLHDEAVREADVELGTAATLNHPLVGNVDPDNLEHLADPAAILIALERRLERGALPIVVHFPAVEASARPIVNALRCHVVSPSIELGEFQATIVEHIRFHLANISFISPEILFYCDPPYPPGGEGAVAWLPQEHLDFLQEGRESDRQSSAIVHDRPNEQMGWTIPLYTLQSLHPSGGEPVAWMVEGGSITTSKPTARVWEADFGCTVIPLVPLAASPPAPSEAMEALKPFSDFAGILFSLNRNASEPFYSMTDQDGNTADLLIGDFFRARAALSGGGL